MSIMIAETLNIDLIPTSECCLLSVSNVFKLIYFNVEFEMRKPEDDSVVGKSFWSDWLLAECDVFHT